VDVVVLTGGAEVAVDVLSVVDEVGGEDVVGPLPGMHWWYHWFCWKQ
jgi:hypothetical protein